MYFCLNLWLGICHIFVIIHLENPPALYTLASRWKQTLIFFHCKQILSVTHFLCLSRSSLDEPTCSMSLSRSTFLKTVNQNSGMPLGSSFSSSFFSSSNLAFSFISSWMRETFSLQNKACSTIFSFHIFYYRSLSFSPPTPTMTTHSTED